MRYLYACSTINTAHAGRTSDNSIANLDIQEVTPTTTDKNIPTYFNAKYISHH